MNVVAGSEVDRFRRWSRWEGEWRECVLFLRGGESVFLFLRLFYFARGKTEQYA
jgi:hypothetical protein